MQAAGKVDYAQVAAGDGILDKMRLGHPVRLRKPIKQP